MKNNQQILEQPGKTPYLYLVGRSSEKPEVSRPYEQPTEKPEIQVPPELSNEEEEDLPKNEKKKEDGYKMARNLGLTN